MYNERKRIISNNYVMVEKEDNLNTGKRPMFENLEYEHRVIAEEMLGRRLKEGEEVHHLDENRSNNSPDNLLVLSGPMHMKLHTWLQKNTIIPNKDYEDRVKLGCVRCLICEKPIPSDQKFCSVQHSAMSQVSLNRPDKETLELLVKNSPMVVVAKQFNVSDKTIKSWCDSLDVKLITKRGPRPKTHSS